jgi:subtilisin-like proprotein convertase family protein
VSARQRATLLLSAIVTALVAASGTALAVGSDKDTTTPGGATPDSAAPSAVATTFRGFPNRAPILVPGAQPNVTKGPASPYPSNIKVSGFPKGSTIKDLNLTINHFSHNFPRDVDMLLVGPNRQSALVMSDVGGPAMGGGPGARNVTFTLDDEATNPIDPFNLITNGVYKPTDSDPPNPDQGDNFFPAPAPAPNGNTALSVFDGSNPNGTWKLFIVDDGEVSVGRLAGGWSLGITAKVPKK